MPSAVRYCKQSWYVIPFATTSCTSLLLGHDSSLYFSLMHSHVATSSSYSRTDINAMVDESEDTVHKVSVEQYF